MKPSHQVLICLSLLVFAVAGRDVPPGPLADASDHCMEQEKVTEDDVKKFVNREADGTLEMKNFLLCVAQTLGVWDGANWHRERIAELVPEEQKMKGLDECLAQDDKSKTIIDRNYDLAICGLEKDAII